MSERFKVSLSSIWLVVSLFSLILPVFLPSTASLNPASNVIGAATATMFILSFPSSLLGIPLLVFIDASLGIDPNSIQGMYVNIFLLFVLGLVQWFWIVPRIWRREKAIQTIEIPNGILSHDVPLLVPAETFSAYDSHDQTPVERIIREDT